MTWLDAIVLGSAVFALHALVRHQIMLWRVSRRARTAGSAKRDHVP